MAEYRIIVDFNGGGDGTKLGDTLTENEEQKRAESYMINGSFNSSIFNISKQALQSFASLFTVSSVAQSAKQIFSNVEQRVDRYTGSQQAQDIANATIGVAGMILRPLSSTVNLMFELADSQYQQSWESIGLTLARERGGVTLNRSRLS